MGKKRILIIEDENAIAEILEFNLRKNSYECVRVDSGEKALALLDNGRTVALPRAAATGFKKAWGSYWLDEGNFL